MSHQKAVQMTIGFDIEVRDKRQFYTGTSVQITPVFGFECEIFKC